MRIVSSSSRRRRAFTLVELLVVIGIVALLISILLPALWRTREQAYALKCATQMKAVGQAIMIYAQNNRGFLYPTNAAGDLLGSTQPDKSKRWPAYVFDDMMRSGALNASNNWVPEILRCTKDEPSVLDGGDADPFGSYHSYNYNAGLFPKNKLSRWFLYGNSIPGYTSSEIVLMVEKLQNLHDWHIDVRPGDLMGTRQQWYKIQFDQDWTDPGLPDNPRKNNRPKYKHGRMLNYYLFLDFSVRNEPQRCRNEATQGAPHNYYYE